MLFRRTPVVLRARTIIVVLDDPDIKRTWPFDTNIFFAGGENPSLREVAGFLNGKFAHWEMRTYQTDDYMTRTRSGEFG